MNALLTIASAPGYFLPFLSFLASILVLPFLTTGLIAKVKARLQNRVGPPLWQSYFDLMKLIRKDETISKTASWIFRSNAAVSLAVTVLVAAMVPWLSYKPAFLEADLFLVIYLFALNRFLSVLASMDTASPFGAFAGSREVILATLTEPAMILSLVSVCALAKTSNLNAAFSFCPDIAGSNSSAWFLVGCAIILSSLVELSRMPVDDPCTHLELTMVHEAMILENSGKNLALIQLSQSLRMTVLFGLASQCLMHAMPFAGKLNFAEQGLLSFALILLMACLIGVLESLTVKLQWRKAPHFIAYCLTMGSIAGLIAIGQGILK